MNKLQELHAKAKQEIIEAPERCSVDFALKRFLERSLEALNVSNRARLHPMYEQYMEEQ